MEKCVGRRVWDCISTAHLQSCKSFDNGSNCRRKSGEKLHVSSQTTVNFEWTEMHKTVAYMQFS